jgi:tRNA (guanine-N7-)-methyltransferase
MYRTVLNYDGEIHFKTDNEKLFEFSLNEIASNDWQLKNISLDLANSDFENVTTEYEDKFMSYGMKIFRCEAKKR